MPARYSLPQQFQAFQMKKHINYHFYRSTCIGDIALVLQQNRLRWYGHVLRKEDDDWVKKCMDCGPGLRGRPKRTWREVVREDCQARKLNTEDAMEEVNGGS